MKNVKKILIAILAMILCASTMTSCLGGLDANGAFGAFDTNGDSAGTMDPDSNKDNGEQPDSITLLEKDGNRYKSSYTIIYYGGASAAEIAFANNLSTAIKQLTGVTIKVKSDIADLQGDEDPSIYFKDQEILIGTMNNRGELIKVPAECDVYGVGYSMFLSQERLVFNLGSQTGAYFALRDFIYTYFGQDLDELDMDVKNLTSVTSKGKSIVIDYKKTNADGTETIGMTRALASEHLPYINIGFNKYTITHDGSYTMKRMAFIVRDGLMAATGKKATVQAMLAHKEGAYIRLQLVSKTEAEAAGDNWLEPGKYTIEYANKGFTIKASSYYGFTAAASYFKSGKNAYGFYNFGAEEAKLSGEYVGTGIYESTNYATNKQGDYRVMFYNVLFGNSAGGENPGDYVYSVPADERNDVQILMFAEYMPDVLGCQEFNVTKRGGTTNVQDHKGTGGLVALLADIGYVEAINPVVKNAYREDEIIDGAIDENGNVVADMSLTNNVEPGTPMHGYGTGGAYNIDGTNTYFNNTPLFYNSKTTKLVEAEYYWYKYQWDKIGMVKDPLTGEIKHHSNSAGDAGSKAATWGVFESLATGQQYIVISTHMCTRSDYIRELQGLEIVALIEKLAAQYPEAPIFFGGDMNGNHVASNYGIFTSTDTYTSKYRVDENGDALVLDGAGLLSLQDSRDENGNVLTPVHCMQTISSHGYPEFSSEDRIMTPGRNDESHVNWTQRDKDGNLTSSSIDQIYVTNLNADVQLNVFGMVIDNCTLSGSDHLPMFVDFSIFGETHDGAEWGPDIIP